MEKKNAQILLIEDDPIMAGSLRQRFKLEGYDLALCQTVSAAKAWLAAHTPDLVLSDIRLPDGSGAELFLQQLEKALDMPAWLFMTGYGSIEQAVELVRLGATDYIAKPFDLDQLIERIDRLLSQSPVCDHSTLGISEQMILLDSTLRHAINFDAPLLITGETGVGKEVIARYIHQLYCHQQGRDLPFEAINCAAIPETLVESELFGHEKGAFTGADRQHKGVFERAGDGVVFLDEIGDMPLLAQAKLLRVLQERTFYRVGGEQPLTTAARLVFATHADLNALVEQQQFREDLLYRINTLHMEIPPLRERPDDIIWLANRIMNDLSAQYGLKRLAPSTVQFLLRHSWPGNVRELRNTLERAFMLCPGEVIQPADLRLPISEIPDTEMDKGALKPYLEACEKGYLINALKIHRGRVSETARHLGISRKTLWDKMKKYGIDREQVRTL